MTRIIEDSKSNFYPYTNNSTVIKSIPHPQRKLAQKKKKTYINSSNKTRDLFSRAFLPNNPASQ